MMLLLLEEVTVSIVRKELRLSIANSCQSILEQTGICSTANDAFFCRLGQSWLACVVLICPTTRLIKSCSKNVHQCISSSKHQFTGPCICPKLALNIPVRLNVYML